MTFPVRLSTRVLKFSLQKINVNRTQRISSVLFSKPLCNLGAYNKDNVISVCKKTLILHSIYSQMRAMGALSPLDPSSFSRPELTIVNHVSLSLNVDFDKKVLCGVAILNLEVLDNVTEVILDSSKLDIKSVVTDDGKSLKFHIGEEVPNYGSKLTITLEQGLSLGAKWFKAKPKKCVRLLPPDAVNPDDLNLIFNGFIYKPDIFQLYGKDEPEGGNNRCEHCIYFNEVDNIGQLPHSEHRKFSDYSLETDMPAGPSKETFEPIQKKFGHTNMVTQRGEFYILGQHGSRYEVTTHEELRRLQSACMKEMAMHSIKPEQTHEENVLVPLACTKQIDMPLEPGEKGTQTVESLKEMPMIYVTSLFDGTSSVPPRCLCVNASPKRVKKLTLKIKYSTSPEASALQWLDPNQTSGKKMPFMFSQCQPIHARSILPCQDTPAVKFTYDAEITAPPEFTVLMSALRGDVKGNTTSFRQPMPLPSYLVAIAVGALKCKNLGPRSHVWSETESLEKSAWEFADTERYLQAAEKLCGKYQWTEYDLLVLPPSFPYGGMENPCLTFVTPTLLAGDRSLADVIVHEIMHSWTGNLVTNRNFEHFWLNEGFTVYLERKVTASLVQDPDESRKIRDFHSILGLQELSEAVDTLGAESPLTLLVPDLENVHPDDSFSRIPYEKGSLFLRYIEDLLGGPEVFDEFLRSYLNNYSRKSLDTTDFKSYLYKYFKSDVRLDSVDWNTWLHKPGLPPVIPDYDKSMTSSVDCLVERIHANGTFVVRDILDFVPQQLIYFLQRMVDAPPLSPRALADMEAEYRLKESTNAEIRYRLIRMCIKSKDESRLDEIFEFVNSQGRMKYVRPIYRDLYAWDFARELAIANFLKNEKYMMHVSAYTIRKDLHLKD